MTMPEGWTKVRLEDITKSITAGGTPARDVREYWVDGSIPWLKISDLKTVYVNESEEKITKIGLDNSSAKLFSKGTILFSIFATLGAMGILAKETTTNQAIAGIVPNEEIVDTKFLYYALKAERNKIAAKKTHATQDNINLTILRRHELILPPLETQRNIVKIIEKVEQLSEWRVNSDKLTRDYMESVFLSMFGDPKLNPFGWQIVKFENIMLDTPQNGLYKHSSFYTNNSDGTPILRIDSFYAGKIAMRSLKRVKCTKEEIGNYSLKPNDIVINRVNSIEYLGKCGLVRILNEPTVFESNMMRIKINTSLVDPAYLIKLLCSKYMYTQILKRAKKAVNQASINQKDVNSFEILLPPIDLQEKFAKITDYVEQITISQSSAGQLINDLFNVCIQKAFKGELKC